MRATAGESHHRKETVTGVDGNPFTIIPSNQFGSWTSETIAALQWKLNADSGAGLATDGRYGTLTCQALERHLGLPATNSLYPWNTVRNAQVVTLQAWITNVGGFPVTEDGYWGSHTITGLQSSLNATRF
jgi:hypothetical protein